MRRRFSLNYLRQLAHWVWRGKFHVLTFAAVIITILYIIGALAFYPSIVSAFLSITGLLIILTQQILDARQFADHRPNTIRSWLMSFPTGKPVTVSLKGGVFASATLKARATVSISADATIENKVDFLLRQVSGIQDAIANVNDRVDDVASSLTKTSDELKTDLGNINASLKTIVAGHIVGAYDINLFGITIAICGTLIQLFSS
jgi:hypothetical protein